MRLLFFKQKTAYEMRISDWSSDVCSSDLPPCPSNRKGSLAGCLALNSLPWSGGRRRGLLLVLFPAGFLGRAGVLALGCGIAVDQLDDRHPRHVAVAEAGLQHPAVAAGRSEESRVGKEWAGKCSSRWSPYN